MHLPGFGKFLVFRLILVLPLFTCFSYLPLHAQDENETQPDTLQATLEEIEVKATHSAVSSANPPFSLSIATNTNNELTHKAPITLDDMFNQMPGIWVNDRENYALGERITVRGIGWRAQFGVRGIQVVMDGIPLTMADGQAMLTVVDPIFIRRAELIRGPSSMFWGNSSGGVLYLNTRPPANTQSPFMIRGIVGSYGLKKTDLQYTQRFGNHGISGYASYLDQVGFRDHSEVRIGRAGVTGSVDLDADSRIEYFGAYANMPQAEHPSSLTRQEVQQDRTQANTFFSGFGAGKEISQGQFGVSFSNNSSLGFLKATVYGTYRDLNNPLPFGPIDLVRKAGGGRVTLQKDLNRFAFNFGIESKLQRDDRTEFNPDESQPDKRGSVDLNQVEKVTNHAAFVTSTYTLNRFKFLGSVRYDWINFRAESASGSMAGKRQFQSASPSLGINYSFSNIELFSNLSTGFEAPTANELSNRPGGGNGFNPNLEPEKTVGLELGSRGQFLSNRFSYDLTLYNLWIADLLFPYTQDPTYYRNQGETTHKGVEARIQYDISQSVEAGLTYNLTDAEFQQAETVDGQSLKGNEVPGIAKHRLSGRIHWQPGKFWLTTDFQYVSEFTVNNLNTAHNDEYLVFNGRVSYNSINFVKDATLTPFVAVNNIFDTEYVGSVVVNAGGNYYEPAAGISWRTGLSLQF